MLWGKDKKRLEDLENKLNKIERELTHIRDTHRDFRWHISEKYERLDHKISNQYDLLDRRIKNLEHLTNPSVEDHIKQLDAARDAIDEQLKRFRDSTGRNNPTPRDWEEMASWLASKKSTTDTQCDQYTEVTTLATLYAATSMMEAVSDNTPSRSSSSCDNSSSSSSYDSSSSYSSCDSGSSSSGSCD